jgi:riboflavin synthase
VFTGIIETTGTIEEISKKGVMIKAPELIKQLKKGGSIAVDGACLTVTGKSGENFTADVMPVTFKRTVWGSRKKGDQVNLELPMKAGDRFEGHFLSGHVEDMAKLIKQKIDGNSYRLTFKIPPGLEKYMVPQGSIALNGISLTIAEIEGDIITVSIIPHTWDVTNLHDLSIGDKVNVETDLLAKYAEKLAQENNLNFKCDR